MTKQIRVKNGGGKNSSLVDALLKIGLNEDQSKTYEFLVENGPSRAHKIASQSGLTRQLTYKILGQLIEMGLVEQNLLQNVKVSVFFITPPQILEKMVDKKKSDFTGASLAYEDVVSHITSQYNLVNKKPNIRLFEGIEGIIKIYDDVLREKKDILLIRSYLDQSIPELKDVVAKQISNQVRLGIKTKAITPVIVSPDISNLVAPDTANLVTRRFIKIEEFSSPSQVIIYSNRIAITSYKSSLITTVIENDDINQSFRVLFELLWKNAIEPNDLVKKYVSYENVKK